jgi:hypothetical protein
MVTAETDNAANAPVEAQSDNAPIANERRATPDLASNNSTDDSDNETVIFIDTPDGRNQDGSYGNGFDWMEPANEEHRRTILHHELHRIQRSAFLQFVGLCLFPMAVIIFVIVTAAQDDEVCGSVATQCAPEPRTFLNAFTTRCICDPIPVLRNATSEL